MDRRDAFGNDRPERGSGKLPSPRANPPSFKGITPEGSNIPDPTGPHRTEKSRFIDFPDTPDFNKPPPVDIDILPPPQHQPDEKKDSDRLRDFAPPGELPPIGSGTNPIYGMDGKGGLRMQDPALKRKPFPHQGDYEQMKRMGLIPDTKSSPPNTRNPNDYI